MFRLLPASSLSVLLVAACTGTSTVTDPRADGSRPEPADPDPDTDTDTETGSPSDLGTLQLHMLDVWQGDAVLVVTPSGQTLLVDAGDESDYAEMARYLRKAGIDHVDATLVSHMHADHVGAMDLGLRDHPEVAVAWDGGSTYRSTSYDDYVAEAGARRQIVEVGDQLDLGEGMTAEILHTSVGDTENENNNSVVLKLTHGEITVLLGGDCEALVCERGLRTGPIDVYKVHHHGSSDSTSAHLLREMQPSVALIGVGVNNDYGHPHEETLADLEAAGAEVYRTDLDGNILVVSDGRSIDVQVGQ